MFGQHNNENKNGCLNPVDNDNSDLVVVLLTANEGSRENCLHPEYSVCHDRSGARRVSRGVIADCFSCSIVQLVVGASGNRINKRDVTHCNSSGNSSSSSSNDTSNNNNINCRIPVSRYPRVSHCSQGFLWDQLVGGRVGGARVLLGTRSPFGLRLGNVDVSLALRSASHVCCHAIYCMCISYVHVPSCLLMSCLSSSSFLFLLPLVSFPYLFPPPSLSVPLGSCGSEFCSSRPLPFSLSVSRASRRVGPLIYTPCGPGLDFGDGVYRKVLGAEGGSLGGPRRRQAEGDPKAPPPPGEDGKGPFRRSGPASSQRAQEGQGAHYEQQPGVSPAPSQHCTRRFDQRP